MIGRFAPTVTMGFHQTSLLILQTRFDSNCYTIQAKRNFVMIGFDTSALVLESGIGFFHSYWIFRMTFMSRDLDVAHTVLQVHVPL